MTSNIYYNPEKFNLQIVDELEFGGEYEFDTHIVWKDDKGNLYYGFDAGCSCPTPFDGMTKIDLRLIDKDGWNDFSESILELPGGLKYKQDFLEEVRRELKE